MSSKNDGKKKLAEYLWIEINRAILTSPEVKADDITPDQLTQLKKDFLDVEESGQIDFSHIQKSSKKTNLKKKSIPKIRKR